MCKACEECKRPVHRSLLFLHYNADVAMVSGCPDDAGGNIMKKVLKTDYE